MKIKTDKAGWGMESVLLAPADLADKLLDVCYRLCHTGYTPRGTILTMSLSVLKTNLFDVGITPDAERDFDEEIVEACRIAVQRWPKKFEFAPYQDPHSLASPPEIGLRYYLTDKS